MTGMLLRCTRNKAKHATPGEMLAARDRLADARDAISIQRQLVRAGELRTYGPQLEAYAEAVNRALDGHPQWEGEKVGRLALWFVQTGAWVGW